MLSLVPGDADELLHYSLELNEHVLGFHADPFDRTW
jgi:hypothetical protein